MIVRKLRIEKGLSQEQLAHMAGISTRTLQRIERGANASPETLKCIASALDTDFSDLRKEQDMPSASNGILPELSSGEQEAMEYVRDIRSFYMNLIQYAVVITALAVLNLLTSPGYLWFLWVAAGWGIGVVGHGLSVFEIINPFGDDWEKRQIKKRLRQQK